MSNNALVYASKENNLKKVKQILNEDDSNIDSIDDEGSTPLMIALYNDNFPIFLELIKNGADVNIKNQKNDTPLTYIIKNQKIDYYDLIRKYHIESNTTIECLKNNIQWNIDTNTNINFMNMVRDNKPIFFHFLDGYLNEEGYTQILLCNFLIKNNIIKNFNKEINNKSINILVPIDNVKIEFIDIVNSKDKNDEIIINTSKIILNGNDINDQDYENLFNYCIYILGQNKHQTTIVFFIKNRNFHILSFNSGMGLEKHKQIIRNKEQYVPYYGTCIENIDYKEIFNIILKFRDFNILYKILLTPTTIPTYELSNSKKLYNFTELNYYLRNISPDINKLKLIKIKMKLKTGKTFNNLFELYTHTTSPQTIKEELENNTIIFYHMLIDFFEIIDYKKFYFNEDLNKFNIPLNNFKEENINIPDSVLNKNTLHYYDNELYINDQESGSCSWFSVYWSFIYYYILIINDPVVYINFVKYINKIFYLTLDTIFSKETFRKEYNRNNTKYILMKNICNKFIDLNIIDSSYLLKEKDFLFNNTFRAIEQIEQQPNNFESRILKINNFIKNNLLISDQTKFINNLLKLFNDIEDRETACTGFYTFKLGCIDQSIMMIYLLYYNKVDIFNNLTDNNIGEFFNNILKEHTLIYYNKDVTLINLITQLNLKYNFEIDINKIKVKDDFLILFYESFFTILNQNKSEEVSRNKLLYDIDALITFGKFEEKINVFIEYNEFIQGTRTDINEFINMMYEIIDLSKLFTHKKIYRVYIKPLLYDIHNIIGLLNEIESNINKYSQTTDNINNYYNQLKDVYEYEKMLISNPEISVIVPSYFNNYYPWVLYLESIPSIKYLDSEYNIYLFIIFAHKINLTFNIIDLLNIFINGAFINEEDPIFSLKLDDKFVYPKLIKTIEIGDLIYSNIIIKLFNNKYNDCKIDYESYRGIFSKIGMGKDIVYQEHDYKNNPATLVINKYLNSLFINQNIKLRIDLTFINQFINRNKISELINELNLNFRSLDDYKKLVNFLINNPNYINQSFNDIYNTSNDYLFILFNHHNIIKNPKAHEKFIYHYICLYNKSSSNNILTSLGLLLLNEVISSDLPFNYNLKHSSYNIDTFRDKFTEIKKNKDYINYLVTNKLENISSLEIIVEQNIYIKSAQLLSSNKILFKGITYTRHSNIKCILFDLFYLENKIYLLQDINEGQKHRNHIIIVNTEHLIELIGTFDDESLKIDEILFNNNKVLKIDDYMKLPFSHLIPSNCLNLIYLENEIYKVVYFSINRFHNGIKGDIDYNELSDNCGISDILYKGITKNGTYIFEINNNNLLLPILKSDYTLFTSLCKDYGINNLNILYINENNSDNGAFNLNPKLKKNINFNKNIFFKEKLSNSNSMTKLLLLESNTTNSLLKFKRDEKNRIIGQLVLSDNNEYNLSIEKLLFKINKCMINDTNFDKYINHFISVLDIIDRNIKDFNTKYKIDELFNHKNYSMFYNYLQNIRLFNVLKIINKLLIDYKKYYERMKTLEQKKSKRSGTLQKLKKKVEINKLTFCNQIKIFNDIFNYKNYRFKYKFEAFFEFISGVELQNEQFKRYTDIINSFIEYEKITNKKPYKKYGLNKKEYSQPQTIMNYEIMSGGGFNYPLHHIMMSKGKSAILSPLLALHFVLIYDKVVYVIVPEHLEYATTNKFNEYMNFFNCIGKIKVYSDSKIKNLYLNNHFNNEIQNSNTVMIIDEFDSLIDPIKSNYNITFDKVPFEKDLCDLIKNIVIDINNKGELLEITEISKYSDYYDIIKLDINNILKQIKDDILIENITWGIHPDNYYAIPYNNKDKPLLSSNFTSSIMTLFLTYYYYIIIQEYSLNDYILEIVIKYNLLLKFGFEFTINKEEIKNIFNDSSIELKNKLFDEVFEIIFKKDLLSLNQSNVSFIDIINIKNIFKVGYSGTVNMDLRPLEYLDNKFNEIIPDFDEELNVKNAILNANIKYLNKSNKTNQIDYLMKLFDSDDLDKYKALIDLYGLFKNIKNEDVAIEINKLFKRNVIYLDESDKEYIIKDGIKEKYYDNKFYDNPFLFFDQGHTVGVDIKQDKYPIIKGLCIVDTKINYTQVAQAIFRLRKINLGHTIDFCYVRTNNDDNINIDELYESFVNNDKMKKEMTTDLLIYQTLKYEIRKNRKGPNIMAKHDETIKYYYKLETKLPDKTDLDGFFTGIFTKDEIIELKKFDMFYIIYKYEKLLKLIYNIDSFSIEYTQQTELDEQTEQTKEVTKLKEIKLEINDSRVNKFNDSIIFPPYDFIMYNYIFNEINNVKIFNLLTIKVDEVLYCLPNIFVQIDGFRYNKNTSGFLFVYIIDKLLIIPGYMVTQFMYNYPIININLIIININFYKVGFNYYEIIKKIKNHKIFSNIRNKLEFNQENILLYFIMLNIQYEIDYSFSINDEEIIILNQKIKEIYDNWLDEDIIRRSLMIDESFNDIKLIIDKIKLFKNISNNNFQKYLKYKLKYYSLLDNQ